MYKHKRKHCIQVIKFTFREKTEAIYLKINIRLRKWLVVIYSTVCKSPSQNNSLLLENMSKNLSRYLQSYKNILLADFIITQENENLQRFKGTFSLEHLSDKWTKLPQGKIKLHRSYYHQKKSLFKNTCVTITRISDFHKLTAVSLKPSALISNANK